MSSTPQLKLNIGTQTKTENVVLPEIIQKSPRMILRNIQTIKMRSQMYINTDRIIEKQDLTKYQNMSISRCKQRINQLANDDNRMNIHNFKRWNKEKAKLMICEYIRKQNKYSNKLVVKLPEYEKNAPFIAEQFQFIDKILPMSQRIQKQCGFSEENLSRNNLLLEKIILERLL